MNRYNQELRKVEPATNSQTNQISPAQAQQLMQSPQADNVVSVPSPQSVVDNVFQPQPLTKDPYTPVQRGAGLLVRSIPFVVVYLILAIGIVFTMKLAEEWLYILFGVPLLVTVLYMSERTDKYTPAGVELERIGAAERVEFVKGERQERILSAHLANQQELRRMSLEATLRMLERGDSNGKQ